MRNAFAGCHYGFFFHFLNTGSLLAPPVAKNELKFLNTADWNAQVRAFDAEKIASQMHELQADYVFITLGQGSGYYCSPNSVYDREVGKGCCSERDLVLDFARALEKYGIACYVYTSSLGPFFSPEARKKLQGIPPWNCNRHCGNYEEVKQDSCGDPRLLHFHKVWNEIHREWSLRWGKHVRGWWVDGCYYPEKMYDFPEEPNGHSFCRTLRAGNPDSIIAFNPGVTTPRRNYPGSDEDYTAGEINEPGNDLVDGRNGIDGLRYHVLTYVGSTWGRGPVRGTGEELAMLTRGITDNGGVVTWDIPFTVQGIDPNLMKVLKDFTVCYRSSLKRFPKVTMVRETGTEGHPRVRMDSDTPLKLEGKWLGKTFPVTVPGFFEPEKSGYGEEYFSLTSGGLTRRVLLFDRRKYHLHETMQEVIREDWGRISFARKGDQLIFSGSVCEPRPVPGPDTAPWDGTGLEFFIEASDKSYTQYCLRSDGALFHVKPWPVVRLADSVWEKTPEGYRFTITVPLPDRKQFLLEIYRNIGGRDGRISAPCLGGKRSWSGFREEFAVVTM